MTNPNKNPTVTDSVSQEQAFKDWTAAGNGVPLQYKGREQEWDKKVDGIVGMKDGGAAFGKFPQMKPKRSKQDREAAKNVPVDVARGFVAGTLGMPGDVESLIRMLPGLDEKTMLPTSEDILKRIPFGSDTPAGKAASGLGILGGGFYTGPGSAARAITSVPKAVKRAGIDFAESLSPVNVIKPKGGNWLGGRIMGNIDENVMRLKPYREAEKRLEGAQASLARHEANPYPMQHAIEGQRRVVDDYKKQKAVNDWVTSNLGKYVKNQMGTPEDPLRLFFDRRSLEIEEAYAKDIKRADRTLQRAADEADPRRRANLERESERIRAEASADRDFAREHITHVPGRLEDYSPEADYALKARRQESGFPAEGLGQSEPAKRWETLTDDAIVAMRAGDVQETSRFMPELQNAERDLMNYRAEIGGRFDEHIRSKGLSENEIRVLNEKTPIRDKASILGEDFVGREADYNKMRMSLDRDAYAAGQENPFIAKLDPETQLYSGNTADMGFDHVIDILKQDVAAGRIRPEQLSKVSIEDAVRRTADFDQEQARKMAAATIKATEGMPTYRDYPDKGYKWIELKKPELGDELPSAYQIEEYQSKTLGPMHRVINTETGMRGEGFKTPERALDEFRKSFGEDKLADALKYEGDTMGHCVGGYCPDVLEGRSRIFSLRDRKGEPHVTIELEPTGRGMLSGEDLNAMEPGLFDKFLAQRRNDDGIEDMHKWLAANRPELASQQRIVQIKGKQNDAPKEQYLPYVQDFVKSDKWSDVGDLQNTGLYSARDVMNYMPETFTMSRNARQLAVGRARQAQDLPDYMTKAEYEAMLQKHAPEDIWAAEKAQRAAEDDELLRQLRPPEEGMAKGGVVHMAGGGVPAAIKAALSKLGKFASEADLAAVKEAGRVAHEQEEFIRAAKNAEIEKKMKAMPARSKAANLEMGLYHPVGGGAKLAKPFGAMHSTRVPNPKVKTPEVKILTPEDLYRERAAFFPLVGDKADTGTFLTHIGEKELEVPVGLGGGPRYMDVNLNVENPSGSAAWESGTGRTTALGNQAQRAGESGNPVFGVYTAGSGTNTDFNVMGTNAVLQQLPQSKFTKKTEKAFDAEMRSIYPDWPGLRSEATSDLLLDKGQGELRKSFLTLMSSEPYQKAGLPDIPATRKAIMDPQLYDTPTNEAGFRIARMDPTGRIVEDPLHPSDYPTAMAGELAGRLNEGVDYKDMFSTHFANRRLLSQPESGDYYSFSRAHPIQYADQEWLDKIMKAQEAKNKRIKTGEYAKGGLAAATKSCSCND